MLNVTTNQIKEFGGTIIGSFDTNYIKDFPSGLIKYRIDGFLSRRELMALIAIMYAS